MSDHLLRYHLNASIEALQARGDLDGAKRLADLAVGIGLWRYSDQRPMHYWPDLAATPVHDARAHRAAMHFEQHFPTIQAEALAVLGDAGAGLLPVEESLIDAGAWSMAVFHEDGARNEVTCARFPGIAKIVEGAPDEVSGAGVVMLSWIGPGTHIVAHCGLTNARLRMHLPLRGADGASMRVGDQVLQWQVGRSIVFDDSFEHEVHHRGTAPRLVFLADFFHPEFGTAQRRGFREQFNARPEDKLRKLLASASVDAVAIEHDGSMRVRFDVEQDRRIRRYLSECGASHFERFGERVAHS